MGGRFGDFLEELNSFPLPQIPQNLPCSVTLQPGPEDTGKVWEEKHPAGARGTPEAGWGAEETSEWDSGQGNMPHGGGPVEWALSPVPVRYSLLLLTCEGRRAHLAQPRPSPGWS